MPDDLSDEYNAPCHAEMEAEHKALDISTMIRENMAFENRAWIGVPTDDHHDAESEAWQKVEELRKKRREWVGQQK